jgi:hypothetical protein
MIKKTSLLVLIFTFGIPQLLFSQSEEGWENYVDWAWQGDFRPFLEATYGDGIPKRRDFQGEFARFGVAEIKLGYSEIKRFEKYVWGLDERYLFGSYSSVDLNLLQDVAKEDTLGKVQPKMIRFGFGQRNGYGYQVGPIELLPFYQFAMAWTEVTTKRPVNLVEEDVDILDRYEGEYRFGEVNESALKFQLFKSLAVTGSYEYSVVFPRHIFWEWMGSYLLRFTAINAISVFSERIISGTPFLGPLFYFAFKNGLAYIFYNAMTYNMNWPFTSEKPLTFETFKLGVSFTF